MSQELDTLKKQLEADPDQGVARTDWVAAGGEIHKINELEPERLRELRREMHLEGAVFDYTLKDSDYVHFSGDRPLIDMTEAEQEAYWNNLIHEKQKEHFKDYTRTVSDMKGDGPAEWILHRILPREGLAQLFAESYSGKTICTVDLVCAMATGQMWFHGTKLRTKGQPMRTLYIGAEGGAPLRGYFEGWEYGHKTEGYSELIDQNVEIRDGAKGQKVLMSLDNVKKASGSEGYEGSYDEMVDYIGFLPEDKRPHMVVFDTQIDLMSEADENNNTEYGRLLGRLQMDASRLGMLFLLIHHTGHAGKDGSPKRGRGASAQKSKMDAYLELGIVGENEDTFRREIIPHKVKGSTASPDKKIMYETKRAELPYTDGNGEYIYDEYGDQETYELFWAVDIDPNDIEGFVKTYTPAKLPDAVITRLKGQMMKGQKYTLTELADFLNVGSRNSERFKTHLESLLVHNVLKETAKKGTSRQFELYPF